MERFILSLDQGTTSSRAILFDHDGAERAKAQKPFRQIYPRPGWVEHDAEEIWETQIGTAREALRSAGVEASQVAAVGIANQRETSVFWDARTGRPCCHAIVWQDRRTADICRALSASGMAERISASTGLLLDPYFSGTKVKWVLDNDPAVRDLARAGHLRFGTVDSWLTHRLTGEHRTDPSNASRTMLYDIRAGRWDEGILDALGIPASILPRVTPSASAFGTVRRDILGAEVPVAGILGDQQAALLGQACLKPGSVKITYGTGCFCLLHTGAVAYPSRNRLLTTIAWDLGRGPEYALEGSVFAGGAVIQWLRDELRVLSSSAESEAMGRAVADTGGVYFVPAFTGLGAPWWDPDARGALFGISRGTGREHVVRAGLESIAYQVKDLIDAMEADFGRKILALRTDGGASVNGFLMQFQSDILGMPLVRPRSPETTALGAAFAAGLSVGFWKDTEEISGIWRADREFAPSMDEGLRSGLLAGWKRAVEAARHFSRR